MNHIIRYESNGMKLFIFDSESRPEMVIKESSLLSFTIPKSLR